MDAGAKVNILLVDDQPAKLLSYEAILEPLGENLVRANSGREALERLLRLDIAVVLVDVCMPDLDGFELASIIHQHPRHRRAAIIFVSAVQISDIDRLRGFESGGVDYVSVPVEPEILRARVGVFADLYRKTRQLEQLNRDLEQRVAERTLQLTEAAARLQESEVALRETDRRKDEFLAMLAHELRNPLAPIRHSVEILCQRADQERGLRWNCELIERQVSHLTRLVDDLLDVGRITRGKLEIRRAPAELGEILRNACDSVRTDLENDGLILECAFPDDPIPIRVDAVRLTQVVVNLLDNARKFTPEGGTIRLSGTADLDGFTIAVRDSGVGIAADHLPGLFEMFYQAGPAAHGETGGLGIGLALVRRIVELHGGTVEAQSGGAGLGSEFVVRIPSPSPVPGEAAEPELMPPPIAEPGRKRVLVVDDNRDGAESLAMLLRLRGYDARTAFDGPSALALLDTFPADAVLLDIGLPGRDGYQVAREIRERSAPQPPLLVALTGWGQESDRRRVREAGFDAHLVKPAPHAEIIRVLETAPDPIGQVRP